MCEQSRMKGYFLLIASVVSVSFVSVESFNCPSGCSTQLCTGDENPHCIEYEGWNPSQCAQCEDGYFLVGSTYFCASCVEVFGDDCSSCNDFEGCEECSNGVQCRDYDEDCTLTYCAQPGDIPGCEEQEQTTDETNNNNNNDDDDDTDETTDDNGDNNNDNDSDDSNNTDDTDDTDDVANDTKDSDDTDDTNDDSDGTSSGNGSGSGSGSGSGTVISTGDLITTEAGRAVFSRNGINGAVTVYNGHINISLDFSEFNFDSKFDELGGEECFKGGIRFGIYDMWTHDSTNDRVGSSCDSTYTGSRWDPWLACSSVSGNAYCESYDTSVSCVPNGGAWNNKAQEEYEYICDPINYELNPFVCEVGDWSGKYGKLWYDSNSQTIQTLLSSPFETDGKDLGGMSVLFRCHDNKRAFCAPFQELADANVPSEMTEIITHRPWQNKTLSNYASKIAYFTNESYVYLSWFGRYEVHLSHNDIGVPSECGNNIYYRIFDDTDCSDSSGNNANFYDPTLTCGFQSNQFDRGYCSYADEENIDTSEGYRCDDDTYEYVCNKEVEEYFDVGYYRFGSCSPSDLSAKYGSIDISDNVQFKVNYTGYDPLMIPMSHLAGKSVGLQCEKYNKFIMCAKFVDYLGDKDYDGTSAASGGSSKSKKSSSDETFGGVAENVWWFLGIIVLLSIIPCVKWYKNRYKNSGPATELDEHGRGRRGETTLHQLRSRSRSRNASGGARTSASAGENYANNNRSADVEEGEYANAEYGKYATDYNDYNDYNTYNQGYGNQMNSQRYEYDAQGVQQGMERELSIHDRAKRARKNRTVTSMMN